MRVTNHLNPCLLHLLSQQLIVNVTMEELQKARGQRRDASSSTSMCVTLCNFWLWSQLHMDVVHR